MAVTVGTDHHLSFTSILPPPPGEWEDLYAAMDFDGLDEWYDTYVGRHSTAALLDLGGQLTVTTAWLTANNGNGHVELTGGRWIIHDILCANVRITSSGATPTPITFRDCLFDRRTYTYLYCIHTPSSVTTVHNVRLENCTLLGYGSENFAVYFPAMNYVEDDLVVYRCYIDGYRSAVGAVRGVTVQECVITNQNYTEGSHNTAMSFRGGWAKAIRNRCRPGTSGVSGINFYGEVANYDPEVFGGTWLCYNHLYLIENIIDAENALVTVNFPLRDQPPGDPCPAGSVCFSILPVEPGITREAWGNFVDKRFSNIPLWTFFNNNRRFDGTPAPG